MTDERASSPLPPPPKAGLSLYANLLGNDNSNTISVAPVTYNKSHESSLEQDEAAKKQQNLAASLRFQPTKRPQLAAQKAKAKAIASRLANLPPTTSTATPAEKREESYPELAESQAPNKTTAADWTATLSEDEDAHAYLAHSRKSRKKRKKDKEAGQIQQDWDDIYDPGRPNSYEEYKHSEEKIREVREWKDLLYRHRMLRRRSSDHSSLESDGGPRNKKFAPPPSMSFAAPAIDEDEDTEYTPPPPPPPPPPPEVPDDLTGEEAYIRRQRMKQPEMAHALKTLLPPSPPPPPPPPLTASDQQPSSGQISRAPVRYSLPPPPPDIPASEAELEAALEADDLDSSELESQPRSNRPGQKGFAERLMSKYGWSKGQGLGAQGTGITTALYAKVDKRKKKPDAEGGGYVTPAGTGKIMGGNRNSALQKEEQGKFGTMSEIIRLEGMLNGVDVQAELNRNDTDGGGLMQEIGEECGEKYGSVQRVFIHSPTTGHPVVFVHFVSQLSALRAVNALEGRLFSGNVIHARYWDRDQFENEVYE